MKIVSVILLSVVCSFGTYGQWDDSLKQAASDFIRREMKAHKVTGLSVALVRNDSVIWADGFGMADAEKGMRCTDSTVYRVGSVSKLFTATAIMQLAEQGLLDLDKPVKEIIPEFSIGSNGYDVDKVTVRRLLCHKSGLPSDVFRGLFSPAPDPIDSIIAYLKDEHLTNDPGTIMSYSNPGYTLLGYIVQRVSQSPFEDYVMKNILEPLGMSRSSFTLNERNKNLYSVGYMKGNALEEPAMFELPAGLLHSSVSDLSRFMMMAMNNGSCKGQEILKPATMKEMLTVQCRNRYDFSTTLGICWFLHGEKSEWGWAGGAAEHGGDTYVYHAQLTMLPELKTGVVVLTNSEKGSTAARNISRKILVMSAENLDKRKEPEEKETKIEFIKVKKEELAKYEGGYTMGPDYMYFRASRGKMITAQNGLTLCFLPNNKGSFTPAVRLLGIVRIPLRSQQVIFAEIDGKYYMAAIYRKDTLLIGARTVMPAINEEWRKVLGEYEGIGSHSYSLFKKITLKEVDGMLKLKASGWKNNGTMTLRTISATEAAAVGVGRQTGTVCRIAGDRIYFSGMYYEKVKK
jgi:CubicO group peptidase (beta-lactamase class C family)